MTAAQDRERRASTDLSDGAAAGYSKKADSGAPGSAATRPGVDDSWVTFNVKPSRSPHGEYVWVDLESRLGRGAFAHFQLSRQDAFDFAAQLSHAAEWLRREADKNG